MKPTLHKKNVQILGFVWSAFPHIQSKYGKILTRKNSLFGQFYRGLEQMNLKMTPLDHLSLF